MTWNEFKTKVDEVIKQAGYKDVPVWFIKWNGYDEPNIILDKSISHEDDPPELKVF